MTKVHAFAFGFLFGLSLPIMALAETPSLAEQQMMLGTQAYQRGAFEQAAASWAEAAELYRGADQDVKQSEALLSLADAYQALGHHLKALRALEQAQSLARSPAQGALRARILGSLGNLYLVLGQEAEATRSLTEALRAAKELRQHELASSILNNLGNALILEKKYAEAVAAYGESIELATVAQNHPLVARALINQASAFFHLAKYSNSLGALDRALAQLQALGGSHEKFDALIMIGQAYHQLIPHLPGSRADLLRRSFDTLTDAATGAEALGDARAASYARGFLGSLYETERRYQEALDLTRQAIFSAQQVMAPEALYRWHWQAGRLLHKSGRGEEAIAAYRRAVLALQSIRSELAFSNAQAPTSFREGVGRVYFELADILLQRAGAQTDQVRIEADLKEARDVIELFKVGELRDYFRDDCVETARARATSLELASPTAAVFYPIMLPDRTELLVSVGERIHRVIVPVPAETLTARVRLFRKYLEKHTTKEYLPHAQQLYDWLIRPLEPILGRSPIDTLVFVPDGPLRTIPIAALHDGKQFLIRKYAIATTPGLTLTDARPFKREMIKMLAVGLTESVQGFPPLPNVAEELQNIKQLFGGTSLLNQEFLVSRVERELKENPFSVVHIASHGQFESDVHKSFLLAFDDKLTMDRLTQFVGLFRFRDEPLALLTFSACETAAGDDHAALGLAGVAIKAGARSALATLWFINDQASFMLVSEFYRQLQNPTVSKAVAVQRAQAMMLDDPVFYHPAYWAPFLLLNNWL